MLLFNSTFVCVFVNNVGTLITLMTYKLVIIKKKMIFAFCNEDRSVFDVCMCTQDLIMTPFRKICVWRNGEIGFENDLCLFFYLVIF